MLTLKELSARLANAIGGYTVPDVGDGEIYDIDIRDDKIIIKAEMKHKDVTLRSEIAIALEGQ